MTPGFLLVHNLATPCLGRKPKARVATLYPIFFDLSLNLITIITRFKEEVTHNMPIYFGLVHNLIYVFIYIFVMGQSKMPITKTLKLNFGSSQLITMLTGNDVFGEFDLYS
jgi:hypothetical protein